MIPVAVFTQLWGRLSVVLNTIQSGTLSEHMEDIFFGIVGNHNETMLTDHE